MAKTVLSDFWGSVIACYNGGMQAYSFAILSPIIPFVLLWQILMELKLIKLRRRVLHKINRCLYTTPTKGDSK